MDNLSPAERDLLAKAKAALNSATGRGDVTSPAAIIDLLTRLAEARATPPREFSFEQLETWVSEAVASVKMPVERSYVSAAIFRHLRQRICEAARGPAAGEGEP